MIDDWEGWFNKSSQIRRYSSTIVNLAETDEEYTEIYAALPTAMMGQDSDIESTMLGQLGLANFQLAWRVDDIDENGWPKEGDVVSINGQEYFINKMADHTNSPSVFTLPHHKVAYIGSTFAEIT